MTYPTDDALHHSTARLFATLIPVLLTQTIILFQDTSLVYVISITDFLGAASKVGASATAGWWRCICSPRSSISSSRFAALARRCKRIAAAHRHHHAWNR